MPPSDESGSHAERCTQAELNLIHFMAEEVHLMREILSSIHTEQQAVQNNAKESLVTIMRQRQELLTSLSTVRSNRAIAAIELASLLTVDKSKLDAFFNGQEGISVLLSRQSDNAVEILSLRDQMIALVEKVNKNQQLHVSAHSFHDKPHIHHKPIPKKKKTKGVMLEEN